MERLLYSKIMIVVLVVVMIALLASGCANTFHAAGRALGNVGIAVTEVGKGAGTVITAVGEDMQDASETQLANSRRNNQGLQ